MPWRWSEAAGLLTDPSGKVVANGYSGAGAGKNNPALVSAVGIGPIPPGLWNITAMYNSDKVGPYALILEPQPETDPLGRSAFRIHGDSIAHPGLASHGCIILARPVRQQIWTSADHVLEVTA
jgi:hypothetical protein